MSKLTSDVADDRSKETAQIFKFETNNFILENFPIAYMPSYLIDVTYSSVTSSWKVINPSDLHINDLHGIPSSLSLATSEATNILDLRFFNDK